MSLDLDAPITAKQALLLLVSHQVDRRNRIDPLKVHYCLNLIVFEASHRFKERVRKVRLPRPRSFPGFNGILSREEWDEVFEEKLEEELMTDDPARYGLTDNGRTIARMVERGEFDDPRLFESAVSHLMEGEAHGFFVEKAKWYAKKPIDDLHSLSTVALAG